MAKSVVRMAETPHRPGVQALGRGSFSPVTIPFQAVRLATYTQVIFPINIFTQKVFETNSD